MHIPCADDAMVIQYVDQMNKSGVFKEIKLLAWDNTRSLQTWPETTNFFSKIWVDRMAYRRQQEGERPFDSALALSPRTRPGGTVDGLSSSQRTMRDEEMETLAAALDRAHDEVATLQDELDASTVTSPPAEIIAAATTTDSAAALIAQLTVQGTAQTAQIN